MLSRKEADEELRLIMCPECMFYQEHTCMRWHISARKSGIKRCDIILDAVEHNVKLGIVKS